MRFVGVLLLSLSTLAITTHLSAKAESAGHHQHRGRHQAPIAARATAAGHSLRSHNCFNDPSSQDCVDGTSFYSNTQIEADLQLLCTAKSWMVGCTIRTACNNGQASGDYCHPWALAASLCSDADDNADMAGCDNYRSLCMVGTTVVSQCSNHKALPNQLSTAQVTEDVLDLCRVMPDMTMCSQCTSDTNPATTCPSPLDTVSEICLDHYMDGCDRWYEMCKTRPEGMDPFCGAPAKVRTNDNDELCVGVMQMYFHGGYSDIVLFKSWIPCTSAEYAGTFLVIVFGGVFVGMVKGFRARTEQRWARESAANGVYLGLNDAGCEAWQLLPVNKNQMRQNAIRFCFVFITTLIDYALMLISMTFNVGLFFAVVLGLAMGSLFFGHTATPLLSVKDGEGPQGRSSDGGAPPGQGVTMPMGSSTSCCSDMPL